MRLTTLLFASIVCAALSGCGYFEEPPPLRKVGKLISAPPLRAPAPVDGLVRLQRGPLDELVDGHAARDANVAVLVDVVGGASVVDLSSGNLISRLDPAPGHGREHSISPNGRLFVISGGGKPTVFYDTATGKPIWEPGDRRRFVAWLPRLSAHLFTDADSGVVMLADGVTGHVSPHPVPSIDAAYSGSLPGDNEAVLIGSARRLQRIEHARGANGIVAKAIRSYQLADPGITSGSLVPMRSGRLVVHASVRNIGWLNLDDGSSGTWKTSPTFNIPFAKVDENRIMFDSSERPTRNLKPWLFDVATQEVARVDLGRVNGLMIDTADRIGFMKRGSGMWFGTRVNAGPPRPLAEATAAFEQAR